MEASGDFSALDLSPMVYTISFRAPGAVTQNRPVILKPGQTLDLGTVRLKRLRRNVNEIDYDVNFQSAFTTSLNLNDEKLLQTA